MLPRRLRSLTLAVSIAFVAAAVATGVAIRSATRAEIAMLVDRRIDEASGIVLGPHRNPSAGAMLERMGALAGERDTGDIGFELRDAAGIRLGGNIRPARPLPSGRSRLRIDDGITGLSDGRALVRRTENGLRLTTVAETEPFDDLDATRRHIYLIGLVGISAIVLAGMAAFVMLVHHRIADMRRTVDAIVDGDMARRVPLVGAGGTFDAQAAAFNRMLDRIAELMAEIGNVSGDIAHDLRTPLARLRGQLVAMLRRQDAAPLHCALSDAIAQCDALLGMFAALLRIAEVEGGDRRAGFASMDLAAFAVETGGMMQPVIADGGRTLIVEWAAPVMVRGDRQLLAQALINLIENAQHHTPPGTRIRIAVEQAGDAASMSIADDGPGIPAALRAQALRRFGRLDPSRHAAGHGLGLPLAAAITRLHGGTFELGDAAGGPPPGLCVTLRLPLA